MTRTKYWLSLLAISVVLVAGSLAVSPIAIADDDDDDDDDFDDNPCLQNEIDDDDSIRLGIHSTIAHVLDDDDDDNDDDARDDDDDDDERDEDDEPCLPEPPVESPSISPECGSVGNTYTITNPDGGFSGTDEIYFINEGGVEVLASGFTFNSLFDVSGNVPSVDPGPYTVEVRHATGEPVFTDVLTFQVDCISAPNAPSISGNSGGTGSPITITDPQGRLEPGHVIAFVGGPQPTPADVNQVVDPNTITGEVPGVDPGEYTIEVRTSIGGGLVFPETFTFVVV